MLTSIQSLDLREARNPAISVAGGPLQPTRRPAGSAQLSVTMGNQSPDDELQILRHRVKQLEAEVGVWYGSLATLRSSRERCGPSGERRLPRPTAGLQHA